MERTRSASKSPTTTEGQSDAPQDPLSASRPGTGPRVHGAPRAESISAGATAGRARDAGQSPGTGHHRQHARHGAAAGHALRYHRRAVDEPAGTLRPRAGTPAG